MKKLLGLIWSVLAMAVASAQTTQLVDMFNQSWRYQAGGVDLGTAWRGTNYDDSAWPSGTGLLGLENNPAVSGLIHTSLPLNGPGGAIATYYFRTHFNYNGAVANPFLMISNYVDDGAVFYLNGVEFGRVLMPGGPVAYSDLAMVVSEEGTFTVVEKRATNLVIGDNVLAVEVHQQALNSSDVVFGAAVMVEPGTATTNAGTMEYSFDPIVNNYVRAAVPLTNHQFLIGGGFSLSGGNRTAGGIARIDRSGNPVPGFNGGTNLGTGAVGSFDVYALAVANGLIHVGGSFNGLQRTNLARLNWDGSLDTTFVPALPNARVRAVLPQADGKVIIAGEFNFAGGVGRGYIARLLPNGALDPDYATAGGANNIIRAITPLDDGRLLVGGAFTTFDGASRSYIARLDTNGVRDATFTNTVNGEVYCFTKSGSNFYVGGKFTTCNGLAAPALMRIDGSGRSDASFNIGPGFSGGAVYTITEQYDGRLIVGGEFTSAFGNAAYAYLTRILPDGSHDSLFNVNVPAAGYGLITVLAPDGDVLVGGNFLFQFNRRYARGLTMLHADGPPTTTVSRNGGGISLSWPDIARGFTFEEAGNPSGPWTNSSLPFALAGRRFTATNATVSGAQFYRLRSQ